MGIADDPVALDAALSTDDIEVKGERALNWFDVSAIGSGEMIWAGAWLWIALIALSFGIQLTMIGFVLGIVIVAGAWWLYREMITAVPEPGMIQSYAREGGVFSLGTAYFLLYAPVYAGYMWFELQIAGGLWSTTFPAVPTWLWPILIIAPVLFVNLMGHQITGKVQAALVAFILFGDIVVGLALWGAYDAGVWAQNWPAPTGISLFAIAGATALWVGIMTGILEVQQVVVDEWRDFEKSRDVGLPFSAFQLFATQAILGFGMMAILPIGELAALPIPVLGAAENAFGRGILWTGLFIFMVASTFTTLSVYYMGMGRILALYSLQGGIPKIFGQFSKRAVPSFTLLFLTALALAGAYWTNWEFIVHALGTWSVTTYGVVAFIYLMVKRNRELERPVVSAGGPLVAVGLLVVSAFLAWALIAQDAKAALTWIGLVIVVMLYDYFVVPRTARGSHYREQVLRRRTSAARL